MRNASAKNHHRWWEKVPMIADTLPDLLLNFIGLEYGGRPHAAKLLARDADVPVRTAENWLSGVAAPSREPLVSLMARHPGLEAAVVSHIHQVRAAGNRAAEQSRARLRRG